MASNPHTMNTRENHGRRLSAQNSGRRWALPAVPMGAGGRPHSGGILVTSSFSWAGSGVLDGCEVGADSRKHCVLRTTLSAAKSQFKMLIPTPGSRRRGSAQRHEHRGGRGAAPLPIVKKSGAPCQRSAHGRRSRLGTVTRSSTPGAKTPETPPRRKHQRTTTLTTARQTGHTHEQARHSRTSHTHSITHRAVLAETAGWITGPPIRRRAPLDALRI